MATLAIDFDNVIHDRQHPVKGRRMGGPMPGVKAALAWLKSQGHDIIVHSCVPSSVIADWMQYYEIPYSSIWQSEGKPIADVYLDDKAVRFTGDWHAALSSIDQALSTR